MQAKSIKGQSPEELKDALQQSMTGNFKPTLAIVFLSIKQDIEAVTSLLHENEIVVFGSSTSGEFISSEIQEGGIAIMLLDMNKNYFRVAYFESGQQSTFEIARQLGETGKQSFSKPAFIIAAGWVQTDGEEIIKGIEDSVGQNVTIFGGMAGDDLQLSGPVVFTHGKKSINGLVAIIIDESKIHLEGVATCGWKAIGIAKTVTKSDKNIVYTIDGEPALDLGMKYLGLSLNDQPITNMVFNLGAYYPLQLEREGVSPVMRTAMLGNAEDHSIICAGPIPQGQK